jgi:hypothetical protein
VILPLLAMMLAMTVGAAAFVGDLGNLIVVRTTLSAAADAAALAGAGALAQSYQANDVKPVAVEYGLANVPAHYGAVLDESTVLLGTWDPETRTFAPTTSAPNAVRVIVRRDERQSNAVPFFFGRIFGLTASEVRAEAVAVGANTSSTSLSQNTSVHVTSTKELSNVVLDFGPDEFGNPQHQKFDSLAGYSGNYAGTGAYEGLQVAGVWIKSGCNASDDGPGYGEYVAAPGDGFTVHGASAHQGCTPHVTATFQASAGVTFTSSGAASPVRLVD